MLLPLCQTDNVAAMPSRWRASKNLKLRNLKSILIKHGTEKVFTPKTAFSGVSFRLVKTQPITNLGKNKFLQKHYS